MFFARPDNDKEIKAIKLVQYHREWLLNQLIGQEDYKETNIHTF